MDAQKKLIPSIAKKKDITKDDEFTIISRGHHLDSRPLKLRKIEGEFEFASTSIIMPGVQTHKELEFDPNTPITLANKDRSLYLQGKGFFISRMTFYEKTKGLSGEISRLSTCPDLAQMDDKHLRCLVPISENEKLVLHDFERGGLRTERFRAFLLEFSIENENFHIYQYNQDGEYYLVIDGLQATLLDIFQKIVYCTLLSLGFVTGNFFQNECYVLSFETEDMVEPEAVAYFSLGPSVMTTFSLFTTNPYSVDRDPDLERDETGGLTEASRAKFYEGMGQFSADVFSKLTTLLYKFEKLQRAACIYINSHAALLEIKIPNYYVAIEAITGHISDEIAVGKKVLSPIKNKLVADEFIKEVLVLAKRIKEEQGFNNTDFDLTILEKNINKLNAPPNADKLSQSFDYVGYPLDDKKELLNLLKERNRFLHGSFLKAVHDDTLFREALHTSLRLHFLVGVLILKLAGFSGKIINHAKVFSTVTGKKIEEAHLLDV